jgi:hypothetical protein
MIAMQKHLARRTFLRGAGAAIGLPLLDAMTPAFAAPARNLARNAPCRMAFVYAPNGVDMRYWTPQEEGAGFELPRILMPLQPYQDRVLVLSGLAQNGGRPLGDGDGDHARAAASYLTGVHPRKTGGAYIHNGPSVDQVAAEHLKSATPLASLELGCEGGGNAGFCDSGYSCAYSNNLSWRTATNPMPPENNPRLVFERLFGGLDASGDAAARARHARYDRSILDFVLEDTRRLEARLGPPDRRKLDEYLYAVREVERRIAMTAEKARHLPPTSLPDGIPKDFGQHCRLLFDLMTLAFQADLTRVATFMLALEGSGRAYREIGISEAHHPLTHHDNNPEMMEKVAQINCYHMEQFAYFAGQLASVRDGDGTLLDHTMAVYGSGISDGNLHSHDNLPVVIAGRGQGALKTGRHVRYPKNTPMANLYLTMLDAMGVPTESLGDSNGKLEHLTDL